MKCERELPMQESDLPLVDIKPTSFKGVAMYNTFILASLVSIMLTFGLAGCGKRGDPYRPSEIPAKSQTQTQTSAS